VRPAIDREARVNVAMEGRGSARKIAPGRLRLGKMANVLLPRDVQRALALLKESPAQAHSVKELAKAGGVAARTL
jgi:transcriptional regulator GlxA family with amidase domain